MATILTFAFAFGSAVYAFTNKYLLVGVVLCFYIIIQKLLNWRRRQKLLNQTIIACAGQTFKLNALLDSGNALIDPVSQLPISIISLTVFLQMFPKITADQILLYHLDQSIVEGHYVDCHTVAGKSKVFVFKPDKMLINGVAVENNLLGVTTQNLANAKYDALLNVHLGGCL